MNIIETGELLRNRRNLTGATYNEDTITDWRDALDEWTYEQCRDALMIASRDEKRITIAHIIERLPRQPGPERRGYAPKCIRCHTLPPAQGRTRCTPCQAIIDDELSIGERNPAMMAAVAAAHQPKLLP